MKERKKYELERYLRQNPQGATNQPGTYNVRLLVCENRAMKAHRVEIGLGTSDKGEALSRAKLLINCIYALGCTLSNRVAIKPVDGVPVPINEAVSKPTPTPKAAARYVQACLNLPPKREDENEPEL